MKPEDTQMDRGTERSGRSHARTHAFAGSQTHLVFQRVTFDTVRIYRLPIGRQRAAADDWAASVAVDLVPERR